MRQDMPQVAHGRMQIRHGGIFRPSTVSSSTLVHSLQSMAQRSAALVLTLTLACVPPATAAAEAESFQGVPRIVDGDTLVVSRACLHVGTQYKR